MFLVACYNTVFWYLRLKRTFDRIEVLCCGKLSGACLIIGKNIKIEDSNGLALPSSRCLAKLIKRATDQVPGLSVYDHCTVVGLVARALIMRYPKLLRENLFPEGSELVAACHDIGKISPHFQAKLYQKLGLDLKLVPELKMGRPDLDKSVGYHFGVSQAALAGTGPFIAEIAGRHHGMSPDFIASKNDAAIGGMAWQAERNSTVDALKKFFDRSWPVITDEIHASVIAGLTTVADWIGSGPIFDTLDSLEHLKVDGLVDLALANAGFIKPIIKKGLSFTDIFDGYAPRSIQNNLIKMVDSPGLYILEAPMGEGKTEAALFAAYQILASEKATGMYFSLPTQLTSEKIYERMNTFLNKILDERDNHRNLLLHGQSWLYETDFGEDARPGYSWFDGRKRGLLAPFAVGTIDQALMAVMNVKHGFVRTFGLAGKVVILDEVHTYDAYTGSLIDNLINALRALNCTVVLLSATLSSNRMRQMLGVNNLEDSNNRVSEYPLITKRDPDGKLSFSDSLQSKSRVVTVKCSSDIAYELQNVMERAARGEQVLWIENTVHEAQEIYKVFSAWGNENDIETGLIHSRFIKSHRSDHEDLWVKKYGKEGISDRYAAQGRILVGTQVLEQSLDIDADYLVTQLAPIDMILQRIGRLWRHEIINEIRPKTAAPITIVLHPKKESQSDSLEKFFGSSGNVYAPYVLARSLEVLENHVQIKIPNDMRLLIENTYRVRREKEELQRAKNEMNRKKEILQRHALHGLATLGKTMPESVATRYSEIQTCDVILLAKDPGVNPTELHFLNGSQIGIPQENCSLAEKKLFIRALHQQIVSVPEYKAPKVNPIHELAWLKAFIYLSEDENERVRIGIVDSSSKISGLSGRHINNKYALFYTNKMGYMANRKEE